MDLGIRNSFIRVKMTKGRWLTGIQSEAAPHGRGSGWGRIGEPDNRVDILKMLKEVQRNDLNKETQEAFISAMSDFVSGSELSVFAIPDTPDYGEVVRDRYLHLLRRVNGIRPLLLWRSVAALLGWIANPGANARAGMNAAILSLMANGVHVSILSLEEEKLRNGEPILVPERRKPGKLIGSSFRGDTVVKSAQNQLARVSRLSQSEIETGAMSPWRFAVGKKPIPEIVRINHAWRKLPPLDYLCPSPDKMDVPDDILLEISKAEILLIEGPFAGNNAWRGKILATLQSTHAVAELSKDTVAHGCFNAALRHRLGQPMYFDFLPQLEINAMKDNSPRFVELIEKNQRCRGGEPFRAQAPGKYVINRGTKRLPFWLFKEDSDRGRKAYANLPEEADQQYPLTVSVEQIPGQGFAEVRISSREFDALRQSPINLEWKEMEETEQTKKEVLEEFTSWPNTDVRPGDPYLWREEHPKGSLVKLLVKFRKAPILKDGGVDPISQELLNQIRRRFSTPWFNTKKSNSFRVLDSTGRLPKSTKEHSMPVDAEKELNRALIKLEKDMVDLHLCFGDKIGKKILSDVFGFASWCFWRCPPRVADLLLDIYCNTTSHKIHHSLLREGVARVANKPEQLTRYFVAIYERLKKNKDSINSSEYSGLARVLGTSEIAASTLDRVIATKILEVTVKDIVDENKKSKDTAYKTRFNNALLMLTVLLRHRKVNRGFLDPESGITQELLIALDEAIKRNKEFAKYYDHHAGSTQGVTKLSAENAARRMCKNVKIISDFKDFIYRRGRNRNLITEIINRFEKG